MGLFQKPPRTPEELARSRPLSISPDQVLEMDEAEWYAKVYRGDDVPQLTIRAVLLGSLLGFLLAFTNLYIGLKTGWALGVAITASILAYSLWNALMAIGIAKSPMTILETNCMQSAASSAGYATGGTMVSAVSALLMLSATADNPRGEHLPWLVLVLWTLFLGVLGTVMAIPMKRNLINRERLKFPSGTAAAVTLQSLYSEGSAAARKARALMAAAIAGALFPLVLELQLIKKAGENAGEFVRKALLPADSNLFDWLPARGTHMEGTDIVPNKPSHWTMVMDHNPVMIAAGAIVGLRITFWMIVGSLTLIFALGPEAYQYEWVSTATGETIRAASQPWKAWREIGVWFGVPIMVAHGLLTFALQWRTIGRAFRGIGGGNQDNALVRTVEPPFSWFAWGTAFGGAGVVYVAQAYFHVPWYYGLLAVFMTFFLSLVACRATGESDITPIGAMGKIMQLTYGVLIPQSMTANLMTAGITSSAAGSAADLLNDLKSGYLLGANPRRQSIAQLLGVLAGTAATVTGFYLLVPDATALNGLGTEAPKFPAPAAQAWKAVAEVFQLGLANMHPMHQKAIQYGLLIGVVLVFLENFAPKGKKWWPSATGLGLGFILPFQYPMSMLLGAVIAWVWSYANKDNAEDYLVPVASGVIAGVSIMGVLVAILNNLVFN